MDPLDARRGPPVAIGIRFSDERAVGVDEAVVHTPAIDPDARDPGATRGRLSEAFDHFVTELGTRPAQPGARRDRAVGEAMDLLEAQLVRPDMTDDDATARGPQVDGGDRAAGHRRNAAATPASTGMCRPVVWDRSPPTNAKTAAATCSGKTSRLRIVRWA